MAPLLVLLALAPSAEAVDADPYRPSASLGFGEGTLQGESPFLGKRSPTLGVVSTLSEGMVTQVWPDDGRTPMLSTALGTTLHGGMRVADFARVDAFVPLYPHVDAPGMGFRGVALGDVRLQGALGLPEGLPSSPAFDLAVVPRIGIPTGSQGAWLSRGIHGGLTVAAGGRAAERLGWVLNAGVTGAPPSELGATVMGSTADVLGGAWLELSPLLRVGAEVDTQLGLSRGEFGANHVAHAHLFGQARLRSGLGLTVGAGGGFLGGVGTADHRLIAALQFGEGMRELPPEAVVAIDEPPQVPPDEPQDLCPDEDIHPDEDPAYADGCARHVYLDRDGRIQMTRELRFTEGSAELTAETLALLDDAVSVLDRASHLQVEVSGHVDGEELDEDQRQELSEERAQAVVDALVDAGVDRGRLIPRGASDRYPVDTNRTDAGREANRRVEIQVSGQAEPELTVLDDGQISIVLEGLEEAKVWLADIKLDRAEGREPFAVPPGRYPLRIADPRTGETHELTILVEAGGEVEIHVAPEGAEVISPEPEPVREGLADDPEEDAPEADEASDDEPEPDTEDDGDEEEEQQGDDIDIGVPLPNFPDR